jgi:hypothetical protein
MGATMKTLAGVYNAIMCRKAVKRYHPHHSQHLII